MPIGILGSLVICAALYVAVGFVLTGIVPYDRLSVPDPIAVGIDAVGIGWLGPFIKLGILFGLTSVILIMLLAQPRIFRAMAHDGLLPGFAAKIHPRFQTPYVSTIFAGTVAAILGGAAADRAGRRARLDRHRCSHSPWCRSERWCCASAIRSCRARSRRRRSGWWRRLPREPRCS